MAWLQQPPLLDEFRWREDWFPERWYVRASTEIRYIDVMDVFGLVSASHGAAKTLHTKHFGKRALATTCRTLGFLESEFRCVRWKSTPTAQRTAIPISMMVKLLPYIKTLAAEKLKPQLTSMLEKATSGALVVYPGQESSSQASPQAETVVAVSIPPRAVTSVDRAFQLNTSVSQPEALEAQLNPAKAMVSMMKLKSEAYEVQETLRRTQAAAESEHEIMIAENTAKRQKIEFESKVEQERMSAMAQLQFHTDRIKFHMEKLTWLTENGMEDAAKKVQEMIVKYDIPS